MHGPGDFLGKPFRLLPHQKARIYRAYELRPDGHRRWRRVVWGEPKGGGKTELCAAISLCEFAGPVVFDGWTETGRPRGRRRTSPDIPVAAASYDQANLVWSALKAMVEEGPLDEFIEVFEGEAQFRDGTVGTIQRVAAVAGTNDGRRPTFAACDETHEWTGNKKRVHLILKGGIHKRTDAWMLEITTAGAWGLESVAEDAYALKEMIEAGNSPDDETLIDWLEPSTPDKELDLDDPVQLEKALREANPAADVLYPLQNLIARRFDPATPLHEFKRYNLNLWVETTGESWLDDYPGAWDACKGTVEFDPSFRMDATHGAVIAIDFAQKKDGIAVIVAQKLPTGPIPVYARIWDLDGQRIDVQGALKYISEVATAIGVRAIGYDPRFFELPAQMLEDEGFVVIEFPQQSNERMVPACGNALELIRSGGVVHTGDPVLARHVRNAVKRDVEGGFRLSKLKSKERIDACVALVMALQIAGTPEIKPPPPAGASFSDGGGPITDLFKPSGRLNL